METQERSLADCAPSVNAIATDKINKGAGKREGNRPALRGGYFTRISSLGFHTRIVRKYQTAWTNKRHPTTICGDRSARRQPRHESRWRGGFERNRYLGDLLQRSGLLKTLHGERRWLDFAPGRMSGQSLSQRQAAATEAAFDGSLRDS